MDLIGPEKVWAPEEGPISVTIWVIFRAVAWGSANRPTIATSAIRAGNMERSP
jgi:hypothetical protein